MNGILKGHLALARISNSPTVVSNVLAGAAMGGVLWDPHLAQLALAMILFYTAGMYLNDVCDYVIDCHERPERPLPSGTITRRTAATISILLFVTGCALLWTISLRVLCSGLVLTGCIVLYNFWHKDNPYSPVLMACNRALVYITAYLAFQTQISGTLLLVIGMTLLYLVGLTFIAKSETKSSFTAHWPTLCLLTPTLYFAWVIPLEWIWSLVFLFAAWVIWSVEQTRRRRISHGVQQLIAGIALFDALILAAMGAIPGMFVAISAWGLTLFLQRYVKGT